jgi:hypothetical protein
MAWSSSVPGAYDALVALLGTTPALEGVRVLDGPVVTEANIQEAVIVGFEDDDLAAVVDASNQPETLARTRDRERFTITCAVQVLLGSSTDMPSARRRAYSLFGAVGGALAEHPTLSRTGMLASVGAHSLSQPQTPEGALAQIVFGVDCDAFTRR